MRILVIADLHDNIVRLRHILGFVPQIGVEAIIVCGDWGRALNTIDEFHAVKTMSTNNGMKIYGVIGNADINPDMESYLKENEIIYNKDFLEITLDNRKIGLSHYPTSSITLGGKALKKAAESQTYDILFYGHTHTKTETRLGRTLIVNPGALHRTLSPSFVIYDTARNSVEFVHVAV
jgi:uncharacterized protein